MFDDMIASYLADAELLREQIANAREMMKVTKGGAFLDWQRKYFTYLEMRRELMFIISKLRDYYKPSEFDRLYHRKKGGLVVF